MANTPEQRKRTNPFYVALLVTGVVFCVTAMAYVVMIVVRLRPEEAAKPDHPLIAWLARSGDRLLLIELAVLALATFLAIGADGWFDDRSAPKNARKHAPPPGRKEPSSGG